ncbi:MAG TPA: hypothetical protein VGE16_03990, partial [Albitalea sp.]
ARSAGLDSLASVARSALAETQLELGEVDEALRLALELAADPRARRGNQVLQALGTVLDAWLIREDPARARDAAAGFIDASRGRAWEWFGLYADRFAMLAAAEGRFDAAACLVGHADAAYEAVGARDTTASAWRTRALAPIESGLDAATVQRLLAEGARMDPQSVCSLVLAPGAPNTVRREEAP